MILPAPPSFPLQCGRHRVDIYDPRPDPLLFGARYLHGASVLAWYVDGRQVTNGPAPAWEPFPGCGLPETFELPIGFDLVGEGGRFLRLGSGQQVRTTLRWTEAVPHQGLASGGAWSIDERSPAHVVMSMEDGTESANWGISYRLVRAVRVDDDGLESRTTLTLRCGRLRFLPVTWFAHPFFAHTAVDATAITMPGAEAIPADPGRWAEKWDDSHLVRAADGRWRFPQFGFNRTQIGGLWGSTPPLTIDLDPALGGGRVECRLDRPLDHVVVWANRRTFSPEPKLSRAWLDGETASWTIRYRFIS